MCNLRPLIVLTFSGPTAYSATVPSQTLPSRLARSRDACASFPNPIRERGRPALLRSLFGSGRLQRRIAVGGEQVRFALLGRIDVLVLDVAEAAHRLRQRRDLQRDRMVALVEACQQRLDGRFVVADQTAFPAAFRGVAEEIEPRAAQTLQRGEQAEHRHHPGAVFALLELTG